MKKIVVLLGLIASAYSMNAYAWFTRCEIETHVSNFDLGVEVGGGSGTAICWDATGRKSTTPLAVTFNLGAGIQVGMCEVSAHYSAYGPGFALDNLLGAMGDLELAPGSGNGGAFTVGLNPFGINATVGVSQINVGNCMKVAAVKGLLAVKSGPTIGIR